MIFVILEKDGTVGCEVHYHYRIHLGTNTVAHFLCKLMFFCSNMLILSFGSVCVHTSKHLATGMQEIDLVTYP